VEQAVHEILTERNVQSLLTVDILQREQETFRKLGRGRPSKNAKYRRDVTTRFELAWRMDYRGWHHAQVDDGIFPLLTNDRSATPKKVLQAYKGQPKIEKRFAQLKSDFDLAPVLLKSPERVVGLFTIYFLALLVQALIERELRNALAQCAEQADPDCRRHDGSIDLYPEARRTRRPTARFILDALENVRYYDLLTPGQADDDQPLPLYDQLTDTQVRLLTLLGLDPETYGR
jgi:hypothetical protein